MMFVWTHNEISLLKCKFMILIMKFLFNLEGVAKLIIWTNCQIRKEKQTLTWSKVSYLKAVRSTKETKDRHNNTGPNQ